MAGYLSKSASNTAGMDYNSLLYCKTNIGGYFFDGFISVSHERELKVTQHTIESGASIIDHAYVTPFKVTMEILVSDVHRSLYGNQFENGPSKYRHYNAWDVLKTIQENRIPCSVFTKLGLYDNMLIVNISAKDDYQTFRALKANVTLQEIPIARVRTVKISAADQATLSTEMSKVEVESMTYQDMSALYALRSALQGG